MVLNISNSLPSVSIDKKSIFFILCSSSISHNFFVDTLIIFLPYDLDFLFLG